jgi:hypothetical protein
MLYVEKWICRWLPVNKNPPIQRVQCTALDCVG